MTAISFYSGAVYSAKVYEGDKQLRAKVAELLKEFKA